MLDLLITQHLYHSHTDIDPGVLTDLRSAAVSNENFAQAAIRQNLHPHLQHCSGLLRSHITEYEKLLTEADSTTSSMDDIKGPKVDSKFLTAFILCLTEKLKGNCLF